MNKYQALIKKVQILKENFYSDYYLSQSELELITDALETIQFLEIIFKRKEKLENYEQKSLGLQTFTNTELLEDLEARIKRGAMKKIALINLVAMNIPETE